MDPNRMFRRVALERMSTPEQLDQLLVATPPRAWLALVAVLGVLLAGAAWAYAGRVTTVVTGEGSIVADPPQQTDDPRLERDLAAIVYVPVEDALNVEPGMAVQVSPVGMPRETHGFLRGTVAAIESARPPGVGNAAGTSARAGTRAETTSLAAVRVAFVPSGTPGALTWSTGDRRDERLQPGLSCVASIVTSRRRPLDLLFPSRVAGSAAE